MAGKNDRPKFILLVRHGSLDYKGRPPEEQHFYNRDEIMKPEDIMHLSSEGRKQMRELAQAIKEKGFKNIKIFSSPEIRTRESAEILREKLNIRKIEIDDNIIDVYAPGPYYEGMTMAEHRSMKGNVYKKSRWGKYDHERPEEIVKRMKRAFWRAAQKVKPGETAILVSHGDPLGWLINTLLTGKIPEPQKLREIIYPGKGEAMVAIIDPKGELFTLYSLKRGGEIY